MKIVGKYFIVMTCALSCLMMTCLAAIRLAGETPEKLLARESLMEDARQLAAILESAHPDPYIRGGGRIAFHRRLQELLLAIPSSGMTVKSFYRLLLPFVAAVGDGHTALRPLQGQSPGRMGLPLKLGIVEDSLYVAGVYDHHHKPLLGARVVSIEGTPFAELVERQGRSLGWDNEYQRLTHLVRSLSTRSGLGEILPEWPADAPVRTSLRLPSGEVKEIVFSIPEKIPESLISPPTTVSLPPVEKIDFSYEFLDEKKRIALLRIDGMFSYRENFEFFEGMGVQWVRLSAAQVYSRYHGKPAPSDIAETIAGIPSATETFRSLVEEMEKNKTGALVIDLRKNGGGNSLMTFILCYFLFGKENMQRAIEEGVTVKKYSDLYFSQYQEDTLDKINIGRPFPLEKNDFDFRGDPGFPGRRAEEQAMEREKYLKMVPTFSREYESGKYEGYYRPAQILVVTSPWTYSSGYNLASSLYKLGAVVVGVPSGQAGNCFGDTLGFRLKNSGISGMVSYKQFLDFPGDAEKGKMLKPQYELTYEKLAAFGFDPNAEIRLALEIIR